MHKCVTYTVMRQSDVYIYIYISELTKDGDFPNSEIPP